SASGLPAPASGYTADSPATLRLAASPGSPGPLDDAIDALYSSPASVASAGAAPPAAAAAPSSSSVSGQPSSVAEVFSRAAQPSTLPSAVESCAEVRDLAAGPPSVVFAARPSGAFSSVSARVSAVDQVANALKEAIISPPARLPAAEKAAEPVWTAVNAPPAKATASPALASASGSSAASGRQSRSARRRAARARRLSSSPSSEGGRDFNNRPPSSVPEEDEQEVEEVSPIRPGHLPAAPAWMDKAHKRAADAHWWAPTWPGVELEYEARLTKADTIEASKPTAWFLDAYIYA
ncbi:hypothetical protein KEM52_002711, partial [Ascosphaera acerosa]